MDRVEPVPATERAAVEPAVVAPPAASVHSLAQPPSAEMKLAKALMLDSRARIGVYLGLPDGYKYDDPSYLALYPRDNDRRAPRMAALRLREPGLTAANLARVQDRRRLEAVLTRDVRWADAEDARVGRGAWPARVSEGQGPAIGPGGSRRVLAVVAAVPDVVSVGVLVSWADGDVQGEERARDVVRHLHRCRVEVGRGCVSESE